MGYVVLTIGLVLFVVGGFLIICGMAGIGTMLYLPGTALVLVSFLLFPKARSNNDN